MEKKIVYLLFFLLFFSLGFAQTAKIELSFVGYGENYQQIIISLKNVGEVTISNPTIYVDGVAIKTIEASFGPGRSIEDILFLEPGKHLIEVKTQEGAYDRIEVEARIGEIQRPEEEIGKEELTFWGKYIGWIFFVIIIVLIVFSLIWLLRK